LNKLGHQLWKSIISIAGRAKFDRDVLAFDVAYFNKAAIELG